MRISTLKQFLLILIGYLVIATGNLYGQFYLVPTVNIIPNYRAFVFSKRNKFTPINYQGHIPTDNHSYTLVLKNGGLYSGKTKMRLNNGRSYLKFKEKDQIKRFYPKDTKEIFIVDKKGRKIIGTPSFGDTSWLFQVTAGRIRTFAVVPEWETIFISAAQKDTLTPAVRINQTNIIRMVQDNPQALKKAQKKRLMDAIIIYNAAKK